MPMILKNLFRRKARTFLTVLGISIGVAAIIGLGALADGMGAGYNSMLTGSKADLVLSQPNSFDITYSSVDEKIGAQLLAMPEVKGVSGMLQGIVQSEEIPYFFVFGYPEDSFALKRFQIQQGVSLDNREAQRARGKPVLLGSEAAKTMKKAVGDTLRMVGSVYRIVGIYHTGEAFEDSGAVLGLANAQDLLGKPRQVSLFYIQLKDPGLRPRLQARVERQWHDLTLSGTSDFANKQSMVDSLKGFMWAIGGLAIVLGGVSMMNAQLMSVFERTREIGVLRAVGWTSFKVLTMILGESLLVCLAGGLLGLAIGWLSIYAISQSIVLFGATTVNIRPGLIGQALVVVLVLGLVGGLYPAWRASRLQPVEALRYEGGSSGRAVRRFPLGGMAVQSLWQRTIRTLLTMGVIGLTVGAIMALDGMTRGMAQSMGSALGANTEIMLRQADISDTSLSAMDERIGDKIAALPEVQYVNGIMFTAIILPENNGFLILMGYNPEDYAIRRFKIIAGQPISTNRQIMVGNAIAKSLKKGVGDSIELSGVRFRIVGVYESGVGWEEMGGVATLRDVQSLSGRPRKVNMYSVKVKDPTRAEEVVQKINASFPEVSASLTGKFAEEMPDMKSSNAMMNGISFLAILVGGLGVMNTMLMAVLERTREVGVLRALGWRRRAVLGLILRESLLLSVLGGLLGIGIAFGLSYLLAQVPQIGNMLEPLWEWDIFARALTIAFFLGLIGGLYPAYRATRLQPVEALRYE
jgi:ABC-type antimicrobial peptide transport system permease subunit